MSLPLGTFDASDPLQAAPGTPFDPLLLQARVWWYEFLESSTHSQWQLDELIDNDMRNLQIQHERYRPGQRLIGFIPPPKRGNDLDERLLFSGEMPGAVPIQEVTRAYTINNAERKKRDSVELSALEKRLSNAPEFYDIRNQDTVDAALPPEIVVAEDFYSNLNTGKTNSSDMRPSLQWELCPKHNNILPCLACSEGSDRSRRLLLREKTPFHAQGADSWQGIPPLGPNKASTSSKSTSKSSASEASPSMDNRLRQSWEDKFPFGTGSAASSSRQNSTVSLNTASSRASPSSMYRRWSWEYELPLDAEWPLSVSPSSEHNKLGTSLEDKIPFAHSNSEQSDTPLPAPSRASPTVLGNKLRQIWADHYSKQNHFNNWSSYNSIQTQSKGSAETYQDSDAQKIEDEWDNLSIQPEPTEYFWLGIRYQTNPPKRCQRLFRRSDRHGEGGASGFWFRKHGRPKRKLNNWSGRTVLRKGGEPGRRQSFWK